MSGNAYSVARQYQDWHHPEQHHLYEHDLNDHNQHLMSERKCMDLLNQNPSATQLPPPCENMQYIKVVLEERRTQELNKRKKDRVLATTSKNKSKS